jgi:site-specific recombinase XerD
MSTEPVQLVLFDVGLNLSAIRVSKQELMTRNRAKNTVTAYASSWKIFETWCVGAGRAPLPSSQDTVELFVTWALMKRAKVYSVETVRVFLAAISEKHTAAAEPSPVTASVRQLVNNAARDDQRAESLAKEPLAPSDLYQMCKKFGQSPIERRDHAMLVLTFASGFRRSEIAGLDLRDATFHESGHLVLRLRKSKNDQTSEGRLVRIAPGRRLVTCPVRQLRRWLEVRGAWRGPLFCRTKYGKIERAGFRGAVVCNALRRGLARIGVETKHYGAHSLRSGMATASAENGASEFAIRARTGHKSIRMLTKYVRSARGFRVDPLRGVL